MKSIFLVVVPPMLVLHPLVRAEQEGDFQYSIKDNTATITKYTGKSGEVAIPEKIAGLPVREIGAHAFFLDLDTSKQITGVIIPKGVTSIGSRAFEPCTALLAIAVDSANTHYKGVDGVLFDKGGTTLVQYPTGKPGDYAIPTGVTNVADMAFFACHGLARVSVPPSIMRISRSAFLGCKSLLAINVDAANSNYLSVSGILFDKSGTTLLQYPDGKVGATYTVPPGVTRIEYDAFSGCPSLTSVTLPSSLKSIGGRAFTLCTSLSSVTIPPNVTSIEIAAFWGCRGLASAIFNGNAPVEINRDAFEQTATDFTVRFKKGATGFTSPEWLGYKTVEIAPATNFSTWTSNTGKAIKANFVKLDGESVVIQMEDGKEHKIPFHRLSPASVALAKKLGGTR